MSDHVDGPRQLGEPSVDLTDLFAFTSPGDPARTVLVVNAFPSAGASAIFSNAAHYCIVVRHATVAGVGDAARFETGDREYRFAFRFGVLEPGSARPVQHGTCTLPDGQQLRFRVNDESGLVSPDGRVRIFAGLRSDPFLLAWVVSKTALTRVPNLLQGDNVLSIVIEFDTARVLDVTQGTLFAAVAETTPVPNPASLLNLGPSRFDWIGRPEQTNLRLDNPAVAGTDDLRDLWNQQEPFAAADDLKPLFRRRLQESLADYDMRDGVRHWTPSGIAASAEVFLDDFLLFDVTKPITDASFLEIEKSTLDGLAYKTGGGRTIETHDFDTLLTWLVNRDQDEVMHGGAAAATKPMLRVFPYVAPPNTDLQTAIAAVDLLAPPDQVWETLGVFGGMWHPLMASVNVIGSGEGQLRFIETIDGKKIIERLADIDPARRTYRYTMIAGIPASDYTGVISVKPNGSGSSVEWRIQYWADGQPDIVVRGIIGALQKRGLDALKVRFG